MKFLSLEKTLPRISARNLKLITGLKLSFLCLKYKIVKIHYLFILGFLEYLLDRSTETEKEGRELKFNIVRNLSISHTASENLGTGFYNKILAYAKEGPFYAESHVAVTYEREN